jgi:hypothetical protein
MGLDMYAYRVKKEYATNDFDYESDQEPAEDLAYWRKFNALHGWMEQLYRDRGGPQQTFNCAALRLHPEDIDQLEEDLKNNNLRPINGYFFGQQEIYPEDIVATKKFIKDARQAQTDGFDVYYDSWW